MPYDGQLGTAPDGTPVRWNSGLGRAVPVSSADAMKGSTAPGPGAGGGVIASKKYLDKRAELQAKSDEAKIDAAQTGLQEAFDTESNLGMLRDTVQQAPTGSFADLRQSLGKNVGKALGGLPFVPTFEEATALENLKTLKSERTLGDVSKLKGPLSDKDVQFLSNLQVDPYGSRAHNNFVVKSQTWANNRKAAYNSALTTWADRLGSPRAKNAEGKDFARWWAEWSSSNMPRPSATTPTRRQQQNSDLRARSSQAAPGGVRVLSVEN